mmetsp:Transcript_27333/g.91451  ORF Transcript_27333/g.91451 Transcript_27333/m.91451 type:complete len:119 (+) Transcript_27333:3-359(+)
MDRVAAGAVVDKVTAILRGREDLLARFAELLPPAVAAPACAADRMLPLRVAPSLLMREATSAGGLFGHLRAGREAAEGGALPRWSSDAFGPGCALLAAVAAMLAPMVVVGAAPWGAAL